jgi:hypothetical protein
MPDFDTYDWYELAEMARDRAREVRSGERTGGAWTAEEYDELALKCTREAQR